MSRRKQETVRDRTRSHGTPIRRSTRRQSTASPKRSHEIPGTTAKAGVRETIAMTGLAAKTGTIANTAIRMAEEKKGAEERKFHSVISMAKTKTTGLTNAPSPSRRKQSSSAKMPNKRNQSTTPRSHRNNLPLQLPLGLRHQIVQCHI